MNSYQPISNNCDRPVCDVDVFLNSNQRHSHILFSVFCCSTTASLIEGRECFSVRRLRGKDFLMIPSSFFPLVSSATLGRLPNKRVMFRHKLWTGSDQPGSAQGSEWCLPLINRERAAFLTLSLFLFPPLSLTHTQPRWPGVLSSSISN